MQMILAIKWRVDLRSNLNELELNELYGSERTLSVWRLWIEWWTDERFTSEYGLCQTVKNSWKDY